MPLLWFTDPVELKGRMVMLKPLEEIHFTDLIESGQESIIWTFLGINGLDKNEFRKALEEAIVLREKKEQYPFVIIEVKSNKIIGSTRFMKISLENRKLEIGWTWIIPAYWSKGYNEECKLLMLKFCFEVLNTVRVEILTWDKNIRSRKAIVRIGGKFEGLLRNNVIRKDIIRNTAVYSIIDNEWEETKISLVKLFESYKNI